MRFLCLVFAVFLLVSFTVPGKKVKEVMGGEQWWEKQSDEGQSGP